VDRSPLGWVCHRAEWFEVITRVSPRTQPRYLVVRAGPGDEIAGALPLCLVDAGWGRRRLVGLPFATLCDPLFEDAESLAVLLRAAVEEMGRTGAASLELRTFQAADQIAAPGFGRVDAYVHHEIALDRSEGDLLASFDGGCVRNRIRKALKSPLRICEATTPDDLRRFYGLYVNLRRRRGLPAQSWSFHEVLWQNLAPGGWMEVLLACLPERVVGGLLLFKYRDRVSAEAIGYDEEQLGLCPTQFLFWSAICRAKAAGYRRFDFGRTPKVEKSLVTFKDHWGTVARPLSVYRYPAGEIDNRTHGRVYDLTRRVLRRAPAPVYRALSQLYYRRPV